jgi:hypothetical protein
VHCKRFAGHEHGNARFLFLPKEIKMGSKTQKTETIRYRKRAPNKANRKTEQGNVRGNLDLIRKLEEENRKQ